MCVQILLSVTLSVLWSESLTPTLGTPPSAPDASPQTTIPRRIQHDSYSELILPFGSSPQLLEQYMNASGGIRTGKCAVYSIFAANPDMPLMEHLDSSAGSTAYKHMLDPSLVYILLAEYRTLGYYIVTASVDRSVDTIIPSADTSHGNRLDNDYTGRSLIEVALKMESVAMELPDETVLISKSGYPHIAKNKC